MKQHLKRSSLDATDGNGSLGILPERAVRTVVSTTSVSYAFAENPENLYPKIVIHYTLYTLLYTENIFQYNIYTTTLYTFKRYKINALVILAVTIHSFTFN